MTEEERTYYNEGVQAAIARRGLNNYCPYLADRAGKDFVRMRLDMWFNGWRDQLHSEGLGFNFKPSLARKTPQGSAHPR